MMWEQKEREGFITCEGCNEEEGGLILFALPGVEEVFKPFSPSSALLSPLPALERGVLLDTTQLNPFEFEFIRSLLPLATEDGGREFSGGKIMESVTVRRGCGKFGFRSSSPDAEDAAEEPAR